MKNSQSGIAFKGISRVHTFMENETTEISLVGVEPELR